MATSAGDQVRAFVEALFEPDDLLEVRLIWPIRDVPGKSPQSRWIRAGSLHEPEHVEWMARLNAEGWGVYVGANPRAAKGGKKSGSVAACRGVFLDFDHTTVDEARRMLREAGLPAPTVLVASGHGVHAYWRLDDAVADLAEWQARMRALIGRVPGADVAINDPARVMRLPGFMNTKEPPAPCELVEAVLDRVYALAEFPLGTTAITPNSSASPGGLPPRVAALLATDSKLAGRWRGDATGMNDQTRSAVMLSIAARLLFARVPRAEIDAALLHWGRQFGYDKTEDQRTRTRAIDAAERSIAEREDERRARPTPNGQPAASPAATPGEQSTAPQFSPVAASDLIQKYPELRPPVIHGLLREGEVINLVAGPKVGKSWLGHSLAVAILAGTSWLGLATARGDVLIVDAELHPQTLARRLANSFKAAGLEPNEVGRDLQIWPVRGRRLTIDDLVIALKDVPRGRYRLIIIDALYRFLPIGGEENSNETMTQVYNAVDAIAAQTGAAIALVHHASKGSQTGKAVTDIGSGAGSQSRAADSHLVLRRHQTEGAVSVEAVVRSWPPLDPFVIRWQDPGWARDTSGLNPADLYRPAKKAAKAAEAPPKPVKVWSPADFARDFVGEGLSIRAEVIGKATDAGLSNAQATSLLQRAEAGQLAYRRKDGPNGTHLYTTKKPEQLTLSEGVGGESRPHQPPEPHAPGGCGGDARPPSPPTSARKQGQKK